MSQDITEACPRFCLLEMVCVHLKDLFKSAREREREEEKAVNGSLRVWHRDPIADVCPKQLQRCENESGSAPPALLMINQPALTVLKKTAGKQSELRLRPRGTNVWKNLLKSSAFKLFL